jgi:hypothetical protein
MRARVYGSFTMVEQDCPHLGANLMPFDTPFKFGPFSVDAGGRLTLEDPRSGPSFRFRWQGRLIHARLDRSDAATGRLTLRVGVARVRSTAGTPNPALRSRSFALLRWLTGTLPPEWRAALLADHRFRLETDVVIGLPITAVGLISELTRFALELAPYLELMDEMGLTATHFEHDDLQLNQSA